MRSKGFLAGKLLVQIRRAVSEGNGKRKGGAVPRRVRKLCERAVNAGHLPRVVAQAAGVSRQSIANWVRKGQKRVGLGKKTALTVRTSTLSPAVVELKVVKSLASQGLARAPGISEGVLRIFFRSGAYMECPEGMLAASLVAALNAGGAA